MSTAKTVLLLLLVSIAGSCAHSDEADVDSKATERELKPPADPCQPLSVSTCEDLGVCTWLPRIDRCAAAFEMLGEDALGRTPAEVTFMLPERNVTLADLARAPLTPEEKLVREEHAAAMRGDATETAHHSSGYCGHRCNGILSQTCFWKEACAHGVCSHAQNHWAWTPGQGYVFQHVGYAGPCPPPH